MKINPVYRSLNKILTLMGVERKLFFLLLIASYAVFQASESVLSALALFGILLVFARAATKSDPALLTIVWKSIKYANRYDPALRNKEGRGRG